MYALADRGLHHMSQSRRGLSLPGQYASTFPSGTPTVAGDTPCVPQSLCPSAKGSGLTQATHAGFPHVLPPLSLDSLQPLCCTGQGPSLALKTPDEQGLGGLVEGRTLSAAEPHTVTPLGGSMLKAPQLPSPGPQPMSDQHWAVLGASVKGASVPMVGTPGASIPSLLPALPFGPAHSAAQSLGVVDWGTQTGWSAGTHRSPATLRGSPSLRWTSAVIHQLPLLTNASTVC